MLFNPPLQAATLIRRYKRFLADVTLADAQPLTMHCANTGAMTGCATPGDTIWYSSSNNPKRKYPHSWELTQSAHNHWICVNTARANALVEEAITQGMISELLGYASLRREVRYGEENSRIDLLLSDGSAADCYIEVKSVTLLAPQFGAGYGCFPDAKTERGQKHLRELMAIRRQGYRAVLLFAVLHTGIEQVSAAAHIDPVYAQLLQQARTEGVEIYAYRADINAQEMALTTPLPVR